jgi:hypothetical protein
MEELLRFLFSRSGRKPQIGFAGRDKKAWLWLPGKKKDTLEDMQRKMGSAPIQGCTQLAYDSWWHPADEQNCEVCWFGLDIDKDDNPDVDLLVWSVGFARKHKAAMVRYSCSGQGIHMMWVLKTPFPCTPRTAGSIVKSMARGPKMAAEADGVHVCQANRRMFWLTGGKNKTIYTSNEKIQVAIVEIAPLSEDVTKVKGNLKVTDKVMKFVNIFQDAGVLGQAIQAKNNIYVGSAVEALRKAGETVYTKSGCSGNGHANGHIDILGNKICLWAYADGHVIWNYEDVEDMLS